MTGEVQVHEEGRDLGRPAPTAVGAGAPHVDLLRELSQLRALLEGLQENVRCLPAIHAALAEAGLVPAKAPAPRRTGQRPPARVPADVVITDLDRARARRALARSRVA